MAEAKVGKVPYWPAAMLALVLALQTTLVFGRAINWDEFFHYSQLHNLANGTLTLPLQTLYTRAFRWVIDLPGSAIDHIVTIRWFMLACEVAILAAIIGIAKRFASPAAAWLAALAWLSAGYVFQHGTSFRFDPPATAMLMVAAWIMLTRPLRSVWILATGLLLGTATVLTVKSALYAPVFAGIAWLRWSESGRDWPTLLRLAAIGLMAAVGGALVYWLHASTMPGQAEAAAKATLGQAGGTMFSLTEHPYWRHHLKGAATAPLVAILLIAFPFVIAKSARPLAQKLALVGLVLPLSTLLFYHNTAPYYFVFMLAPVCAALAVVLDSAMKRYAARSIAIVLAVFGASVWLTEKPAVLSTQRELITVAEAAFPDRPAYFDSCAMIGRFPKANFFMTPIGLSVYRQGGYPPMSATMAEKPVPLVVVNDPLLERVMLTREAVPQLLPQDLAALRSNYIPFWGPFWVAGYDVNGQANLQVQVPGAYRIEGGDLVLDGKHLRSGQTVEVARGPHLAAAVGTGPVRLVWAKAVHPKGEASTQPFFVGF